MTPNRRESEELKNDCEIMQLCQSSHRVSGETRDYAYLVFLYLKNVQPCTYITQVFSKKYLGMILNSDNKQIIKSIFVIILDP